MYNLANKAINLPASTYSRMKFTVILTTLLLIFVLTFPDESFAKKKKSKKASKSTTSGSTKIDSKTLKCLVCRATVNEYAWAVLKVDPKKMVDTGTWRLDENGESKRKIVPYARSQTHLMEVSETVCKENFEEYAQASWKKSGKPTIIRLQTHTGNMNPDMSKVDIVPDEDLNKALKFHCEGIIEDAEDHFLELFADTDNIEESQDKLVDEICYTRAKFCQASVKDEL